MPNLDQPIHGIRRNDMEGWEVWSIALHYPVKCGSAADARRVAAALELAFPRGASVDYSEADEAISRTGLA
jgi:hypothetical protein